MRVFELAKELNIPSKDLIKKIQGFGIKVKNNFNQLNDDQVNVIKANVDGGSPTDQEPPRGSQPKAATSQSKDGSLTAAYLHDPAQDRKQQPRRLRKRRRAEEEELESPIQEPQMDAPTSEPEEAAPTMQQSLEEKLKAEIEKAHQKKQNQYKTPDSLFDQYRKERAEETERNQAEAAQATDNAVDSAATDHQEPARVETPQKDGEATKVEEPKPPRAETPKRNESDADSVEKQKEKEKVKGKSGKDGKPIEPFDEDDDFDEKGRKDKKGIKAPLKRLKKSPKEPDPVVKRAKVSKMSLDGDDVEEWVRPSRRSRDRRKNNREKQVIEQKHTFNPRKKSIKIPPTITVAELAGAIGIKAPEIIKKLMEMGIMVTINQRVSGENAELIASEFDIEVQIDNFDPEDLVAEVEKPKGDQIKRAPIVTIMGHVDHGKTSLLDKIRSTQVTEGEAGGITQHIGAYYVKTEVGDITFLDTPGHEAFTAMRARGANLTDIVVLVVAADDGIQPQTVEAIHHAQAAEVPIIVAINKIDKPDANPQRVQQELLNHSLVAEDYGGETLFAQVSAKQGDGIDNLLELIQLQAEMLELTASTDGHARGAIIESHIDKGRGSVGTVLIQSGTLSVGDSFVVGRIHGKVRAMFNDRGDAVEKVSPSIPVEILGFNEIPEIGERFIVVEDDKTAKQIADSRLNKHKESISASHSKMNLENLFNRLSEEEVVELKMVLKADVHGSLEALMSSLQQLGNDKVTVKYIHTAVGSITETDVMLASASDAIIIGFNSLPDSKAKGLGQQEGVDIRHYKVIYDVIDDVKKALEGLLKPQIREDIIGHCEIRKVFNSNKHGIVIGGYVTDGYIARNAKIRIMRNEESIFEGTLHGLKRFKDNVNEVANNYECGLNIDFDGIQEGDVVEAYLTVEVESKL